MRAMGTQSTTPRYYGGSGARAGDHIESKALGASGGAASGSHRSHSAQEVGHRGGVGTGAGGDAAARTIEEWNALQLSTLRRAREEQEEAGEYGMGKTLAASGVGGDGGGRRSRATVHDKDDSAVGSIRRASPCALPGITSSSSSMKPIREARAAASGGSSPSKALRRSHTGARRVAGA